VAAALGAVADPALQAPPRLLALPQLLRQPHQVAPDARLPAGAAVSDISARISRQPQQNFFADTALMKYPLSVR